MKTNDKVEKNIKYVITHSQVVKIEEYTAELQENIESITKCVEEVKNNPNKIYDIIELVRKTKIVPTNST